MSSLEQTIANTELLDQSPLLDKTPLVGKPDERIMHRGPVRRWLISPEIGALIGAVVVWLFLWGNGETFGTAGTTLNWLDVAAPYGIMATAIALLMIGGEFDLSSGVMTGGAAMTIGLVSRFFAGTGIHIAWAILAAFGITAAIGWFNGFMVNKTGLPSFIITLASFFVMRGVMLVLSKRLAEKVYVDQIKDQKGAAGFGKWIAHEWLLTEFGARDAIFVLCVIGGIGLFILGLLDQSFSRRSILFSPALFVALAGLAAAVGGFVALLKTVGVTSNTWFAILGAVGLVVAVIAFTYACWTPRTPQIRSPKEELNGSLSRHVAFRCYLGVLGVAAACLTHVPFDRNERRAVLSWMSPSIRPVIVIGAAVVGFALAVSARISKTGSISRPADAVGLIFLSAYAAVVLCTLVVSILQLATVQAIRAVGMIVLGAGGIILLLAARREAAVTNRIWHLIIGATAAAGIVAIGLVTRMDSSASRFRTVLPTALVLAAAAVLANSFLEYAIEKRTFGIPAIDRLGKRLQVAGVSIAIVGIVIRLAFTNFTAENAQRMRDAGEPVPQNVLRQTVLWWLLVAAIGSYVLAKTKWGNWIFAVGGNKDAARAIGVPANNVKIALFVTVSLCAALSGTLIALRYGTVQADQGTGLEFEFIIAAVVGGCLMTGGYGSVIGASLGAAILAMSTTGFQTVANWNGDGRYAFLGGVLLVAVLVNTYIRRKALEAR